MSVLVDTNVLLRRGDPTHLLNELAVNSVAKLLGSGEPVCFTMQNVSEFWNVATRPSENNGLGLPVEFVLEVVEDMDKEFILLPDNAAVYEEWKSLVVRHKVLGSKVHDAKLVAAMHVHEVSQILTFNTTDFARYDVEALHPSSVL